VFLVNSRLGLVSAPPARSPREAVHRQGSPFSRSYGGKLPSSLTRDHPSTLVLSYPATSVGLRYGRSRLPPGGFSWRPGSTESPRTAALEFPAPRPDAAPKDHARPARLDAPCPLGALGLPDPAPRDDLLVRER
jgi:hypothetical protein